MPPDRDPLNLKRKPPAPKLDMSGDSSRHGPQLFLLFYVLATFLLVWTWQSVMTSGTVKTIPYSEFKSLLREGKVTECAVGVEQVTGRIGKESPPKPEGAGQAPPSESGSAAAAESSYLFRTVRIEDPDLVKELEQAKVEFTGVKTNSVGTLVVAWLLPIVLMVALWIFLARRIGNAAGGVLSIGKSRARFLSAEGTGVKFRDVAGCDEAKHELEEVVQFLKQPEQFQELGARIPRGILLVGPPGTGKTLLARAVAGEAEVPFFSLSGSEFVEMFVGVGAARVRDLFQNAKQHAQCIVFIDELDAMGRTRGVHIGAANDEREQTLNQLLVEMDGFEPNAGVIILSATNRPDVLDRALLRPGRFDRQVVVDSPDAKGREAILRVHARDKPLHRDVDLERVARGTPGFSGADLANALNEAALLAAGRGAKAIHQADLESAVEKVVAGPERKSRCLGPEDKYRVACHETGHALVAAWSEGADPVHKISIVPRGRAALGYTLQWPEEEQFLQTRPELLARIRCLLGGRAAEEIVLGEVSTGAANDLEQATALVKQMICHYGMSQTLGLTRLARRDEYLGMGQDGAVAYDCSEETAREIDVEAKRILDQALEDAKRILITHRDQLDTVVAKLMETEFLEGDEFYEMIQRPRPSKKPGLVCEEPGAVPGMPA